MPPPEATPPEATPLVPHTRAQFLALTEKFEPYLEHLLASPVFGRGPGRTAAPRKRGVYLFTEVQDGEPKHLYVGRVGLTERAAAAGVEGYSNFRTRLAGHSRPSSRHSEASFAYRLTVEKLGPDVMATLPVKRAERSVHAGFEPEFKLQKERVTEMEFRVVEIDDPFESYTFEPYAAYRLGTPYNSWATS